MEIKPKMEFVSGSFDTKKDEMVCIQKRKYGDVHLSLKSEGSMSIGIAQIKLYDSDLARDADATFEDACKLGKEIVRRWNECPTKK